MKRIFILLAFLITVLCTHAQDLDVITYTSPERLVNDYTKFLGTAPLAKLESKLVAFDNKTSTQIAILMVKTLGGRNLEETATTIFNSWGLGQKGKNNGILILVATSDRKIRIEIGDGLREVITNEDAAGIIQNDIGPSFKAGKYFEGLNKATASLMMRAVKAFPPINGANKMDAPVFNQSTPTKETQEAAATAAGKNATAASGKESGNGWSWPTFFALVIPYLIWKFFKNMYLRNKYAKEMLASQRGVLQAQGVQQGQYVQPGVTVNNYNNGGLSWWQWLWLRRRNKIEQHYNQNYYYGNNSSSGSSSSGSSGSSGGGWFKGSGGGSSSGSGSSGSWGGKSSGGSSGGGGSYSGGGGGSSSGGGASGGW